MECDRAREGLWPPERPRICRDEIVEARRHVESCPGCREFFAQDRRLLDALDRARAVRAPSHVRERVWDALARERSDRARPGAASSDGEGGTGEPPGARSRRSEDRRRTLVSPLLLVLAAVTAGVVVLASDRVAPPPTGEPAGRAFVEDYLRRAVGEDYIESTDPREVAHFLARELGTPLDPLRVDGFEIARAEICLLDGVRGAMVLYRDGADRAISHYMVPRPDGRARAPARSAGGEHASPTVVTWSDGEVEQALVGEVDPGELIGLARSLRSAGAER